MISIGVHCVAYDKHSCAMHWNEMANDEHSCQCIWIALLMLIIVVQSTVIA